MSRYYEITTALYESANNISLVNQTTKGDLASVLNNKQNLFPLVHIIINSCTFDKGTMIFNISIICMDLVDFSKDQTVTLYTGNNNEDDVMNTTLSILNRVYEEMYRGSLFSELYQIENVANCEPFFDKFEENVAGWTMTFDVVTQNDMTIC